MKFAGFAKSPQIKALRHFWTLTKLFIKMPERHFGNQELCLITGMYCIQKISNLLKLKCIKRLLHRLR